VSVEGTAELATVAVATGMAGGGPAAGGAACLQPDTARRTKVRGVRTKEVERSGKNLMLCGDSWKFRQALDENSGQRKQLNLMPRAQSRRAGVAPRQTFLLL